MKKTGMLLAATVATLFATAGMAKTHEAKIKCMGGNTCKGQSACQTASHGCKGENACKGKGYVMVQSEKACTELGGKVDKN